MNGVVEVEGGGNYELSMVGEQLVPFASATCAFSSIARWSRARRLVVRRVVRLASLAIASIQSGATTATIQAGGRRTRTVANRRQGFIHSVDIDVAML